MPTPKDPLIHNPFGDWIPDMLENIDKQQAPKPATPAAEAHPAAAETQKVNETPAAPVAEAPKVETPAAPVVETPKVEAPAVPVAEAPKVETPAPAVVVAPVVPAAEVKPVEVAPVAATPAAPTK